MVKDRTARNLNSINVTERVREVTITTAPGTHWPWGHPHELKFEKQYTTKEE